MAVITTEFDTMEKSLTVKMDGKAVTDVDNVEFFKSFIQDDVFHMRVEKVELSEDKDMTTVTRIMAKEGQDVKVTSEVIDVDAQLREALS